MALKGNPKYKRKKIDKRKYVNCIVCEKKIHERPKINVCENCEDRYQNQQVNAILRKWVSPITQTEVKQ